MSVSKRLIVNADCLGLSTSVGRAILETHRMGILTSASLRVDGPQVEATVARALRESKLGLGLHVVLTGGRPVSPPVEIPSLSDARGRLRDTPKEIVRAQPEHVLAEVRAQLRRFRALVGRLPTHLDTHVDAHQLPVVLEALVTLSWELALPVRCLTEGMLRRLREDGLPTADVVLDITQLDPPGLEGLVVRLMALEPGITELRCPCAGEEGGAVLDWLRDREVRQALQAAGIQTTHYGALNSQ